MKVVWSETAARELSEIHDALTEAASAEVATGVVERLLTRADRIASFPEMTVSTRLRSCARREPHRDACGLSRSAASAVAS